MPAVEMASEQAGAGQKTRSRTGKATDQAGQPVGQRLWKRHGLDVFVDVPLRQEAVVDPALEHVSAERVALHLITVGTRS